MSSNNKNEKMNTVKLPLSRVITVFMLLALLIIGLVSTTFASFVPENANGDNGSLIAQVKSAVVNRSKDDLADTGANVDVAETSATVTSDGNARLYFNMKAVSWWTAGSNGNGNFAYFFNNSTGKNAWSAHAVNYSGDTYYVVIPSGSWAGVILTRNNTSTSPSWDNKWNQTGDIVLSSSSNYISKFSEGSASVTWGTAIKPASTASLSASATEVEVDESVTLTPTLSSNSDINDISSTSYSVTPATGSVSGSTFTATAAGTYTVTATVTYHPAGYSSLTSTATCSKTITVIDPGFTYTVVASPTAGGTVSPTSGKATSVQITATANSGYKFKKWTTSSGSVASSTSATTTFTPTANGAKATANFVKVYSVTYNASGGSGAPATASNIETGTSYTISSTKPTKTGYTFKNWNTASDGTGTSYVSGATISSVTSNITLYAQYDINKYTITYDANGGSGAPANGTADYNTNYTVSSTKPTKTGYTFKNWNTKSDGTGTSYAAGATISNVKANITLYAQYTLTTYTITYKDGSTTLKGLTPTSYNYETTVTLSTKATKIGYVFQGWYSNSSLTGSAVTKITKGTTTGNKTYYAKWVESNHSLSVVDVEGNSISSAVKVTANNTTIAETSTGSGVYNIPNLSKVQIQVTAQQGYYARILDSFSNYLDWSEVEYTTLDSITTVEFSIDSMGADEEYYVEYCKNPTITVVQPQYGSIYITSGSGNNKKYYMNSESVYIGTELTVHVIPDNVSSTIQKVLVNDSELVANSDVYSFNIWENSTAQATITVAEGFEFDEPTQYGKRRIFFTNNPNWDEENVSVHFATSVKDNDFSKDNVTMLKKLKNQYGQDVYYADIPYTATYVRFFDSSDPENNNTTLAAITSDANAYYYADGDNSGTIAMGTWHVEYSDYIATDRATTAQQGIVSEDSTITFEYSCNFGDVTLEADVIEGNSAQISFDNGYLNITPTGSTYDYSLVEIRSKSSKTVKYYLVKLSKITAVADEIQKIFPKISEIGLSGTFSSTTALATLQYNVLMCNFPDEEPYIKIGDIQIPVGTFNYAYNQELSASAQEGVYSGVRFFKVTASDSTGDSTSIVQKAVFGTTSTSSTGRVVYLDNMTGASMSKYNIRACFESTAGRSWVTMQQLGDTNYYRASIPDGYDYKVSFYLTHKQRYANIKSTEEGFNYICYYYYEDIPLRDVSYNPTYQIKELHSDRTMELVLQE